MLIGKCGDIGTCHRFYRRFFINIGNNVCGDSRNISCLILTAEINDAILFKNNTFRIVVPDLIIKGILFQHGIIAEGRTYRHITVGHCSDICGNCRCIRRDRVNVGNKHRFIFAFQSVAVFHLEIIHTVCRDSCRIFPVECDPVDQILRIIDRAVFIRFRNECELLCGSFRIDRYGKFRQRPQCCSKISAGCIAGMDHIGIDFICADIGIAFDEEVIVFCNSKFINTINIFRRFKQIAIGIVFLHDQSGAFHSHFDRVGINCIQTVIIFIPGISHQACIISRSKFRGFVQNIVAASA